MTAAHSHTDLLSATRPVATSRRAESDPVLRAVTALTPPHCYSNDEIARALDLPALPRICRRIGIESRRTFVPLDIKNGRTVGVFDNLELEIAEKVSTQCIETAGIPRDSIAALFFVSCTAQRGRRMHFELTSHELLRRLRLRPEVHRFEIDAGCDGFVHILHVISSVLRLPQNTNALVVVTSVPSIYFDRDHNKTLPNEAQFPNYVFGDGAAAAVVSFGYTPGGVIKATWGACNADLKLGWTALANVENGAPEIAYMIDYGEVDRSYVPAITQAVTGLYGQCPELATFDFDRVYFHQANGMLPAKAAQSLGIPCETLAVGARYDGNTASACIPTLIARDLHERRIKNGSRILLGAVGAGMACSAAFIQY